MDNVKIYGIIKNSFIDYPHKIAATLFLGGCNFNCIYCHNRNLINPHNLEEIPFENIDNFLKKRKNFLEGICITGGEPTLFGQNLVEFLKYLKSLEYDIKLDTNGTFPKLIKKLVNLKLVDYIAMDVKQTFDKYETVTNVKTDISSIKESVDFLINSEGIEYEFRTTISPDFISKEDIIDIGKNMLKNAKLYKLQNIIFEPIEFFYKLDKKKYKIEDLNEVILELKKYIEKVELVNF